MRIVEELPSQFDKGALVPLTAGKPQEKIKRCYAVGQMARLREETLDLGIWPLAMDKIRKQQS